VGVGDGEGDGARGIGAEARAEWNQPGRLEGEGRKRSPKD